MMDASNKIEAIKDEIEEKDHIESDQQILKFNGRVLDDKKTIRDEDLHEDSTLVVEKKKTIKDIKIPKPSGHGFYEIKIDISKTIYDLRFMIHQKYGIDLSKFKIKIGGKVIEDTTVIETTSWETQTITFVYIRMTLTVTTSDGQVVIVQINPHDKVISLKQMIGGQTGWPLDRFALVKGTGETLKDEVSFAEQGISYEGFTIMIQFIQKVEVTFRITTPNGKVVVINTALTDTLNDVKEKIYKKESIERHKYELKSGKQILPDSMTI